MYNVHSVVTMSDEESERLVAEIPSELKELVDADRRTNKEIVEAALWREFGGQRKGALERRIEEKQRRVSMVESEKNERERELQEERQELQALKRKRDAKQQEKVKSRNTAIQVAAEKVKPTRWLSSGTKEGQIPGPEHQAFRNHAEDIDMTPEELRAEVVEYILSEGSDE